MRKLLVLILTLAVWGCGPAPKAESERRPAPPPSAAAGTLQPSADAPVIVAFGDSLTAGYGLDRGQDYPALLQQELLRRGLDYRVVNEGVSGDTTSAALNRVDLALARDPQLVILELGGNDGLRGLPLDAMEANLRRMIERFRQVDVEVVLAGMRLPPNFGPRYVTAFEGVYEKLAKEEGVALAPFLLQNVALDPALMQDDAIHPNEAGTRRVAQELADFLEPILREQSSQALGGAERPASSSR